MIMNSGSEFMSGLKPSEDWFTFRTTGSLYEGYHLPNHWLPILFSKGLSFGCDSERTVGKTIHYSEVDLKRSSRVNIIQ